MSVGVSPQPVTLTVALVLAVLSAGLIEPSTLWPTSVSTQLLGANRSSTMVALRYADGLPAASCSSTHTRRVPSRSVSVNAAIAEKACAITPVKSVEAQAAPAAL